jgi:sugar lactone lactonase YvrE
MRKRKIVRVTPKGAISDFITPHQDGIWGISGIGLDPVRKTLWACSTAYEVNQEYKTTDHDAAVFAFDLESSKLKARYPFQQQEEKHFCDGVVVASDGTVFVADSQGMAVLMLSPGTKELKPLVPQSAGFSPQGMAISADSKTLFFSDYMSGLYAVNLDTQQISRVQSKTKTSLAGIDGLVSYGSDLIAIQNGILPNRVVRLKMAPRQKEIVDVQVLEMNHPLFGEPTLGVIKGNTLLFVANNPISKFLDDHQLSDLPEPVILKRDLN